MRAVPQGVISDCVKRWTAANKARAPVWAYDGRNNLYSTQTVVEKNNLTADKYEEFPLEWEEPGRRFPSRYLCAPHTRPM